MREATEEDESDIARQFAALFADAAHRSRASAQGGHFESASARAGLLKLRDVLELVLALPSTYLAQEAKERSSTAVLVLDWVLHALLPAAHKDNAMQADNEECEESVRQAALAVSSTCRRYLAAMLRTPRPETVPLASHHHRHPSFIHSFIRSFIHSALEPNSPKCQCRRCCRTRWSAGCTAPCAGSRRCGRS
jgi:hypothetical protein